MRTLLIATSLFLILSPVANADEMAFAIAGRRADCPDCGWITAEGAITLDTADRLLAFLDGEKLIASRPRIELHSDGGSLLGALKLGRAIRQRGLVTRIARSRDGGDGTSAQQNEAQSGARCVSACAFAFLGGTERQVDGAVLAVGNFASEVAFFKPAESLFDALELPLTRVMEGVLLEYVVHMGIDPRFVALAAATAPGEIRALNQEEIASLAILPASAVPEPDPVQEPDAMGAWEIGAHRQGIVAFSRSTDGLTQVTLYCNAGARRRHYALIRSDRPEIHAGIREFSATYEGRSAFGRPLARAAFEFNSKEGDGTVRIVLPDINFDKITEPTTISFDDEETKTPLSLTLPVEGLKDATRLAFRNCLL